MIDKAVIDEAARRLIDAASPAARVILFGSHARGDAGPDSDLDFLVVEPNVASEFREMIRLRRTLRGLRVPADVIVVSSDAFEKRSAVKGDFLHTVAHEGRDLSDPAESADLLLEKAREDRDAAQVLAASDRASDAVVGFHAQQAVEKAFKAVLVAHQIEFMLSHDLDYLAELVEAAGIEIPGALADADELTPFVVQLRYERPSAVDVDRERAAAFAVDACAWAAGVVAAAR